MQKRKYTREFKQEAVRLSYEIGAAQAARELGLNPNMLYRWRSGRNQDGNEALNAN